MLRGLYLCAKEHRIARAGMDIKYNDIEPFDGIDFLCSCEEVPLDGFDFILATPPCNYYSKANYRREVSRVAQATKHLLPWCLDTLKRNGKPFLVENVENASLVPYRADLYQFVFGKHTFWSNMFFLVPNEASAKAQNKAKLPYGHRDDNYNVHIIIDVFLDVVRDYYGVRGDSNG